MVELQRRKDSDCESTAVTIWENRPLGIYIVRKMMLKGRRHGVAGSLRNNGVQARGPWADEYLEPKCKDICFISMLQGIRDIGVTI